MTFQKLTVPGLSDDDSATLNRNLERLHGARRMNMRRSALYDGKNALSQMQNSGVVPPQYFRMGIALGWSAKAVDGLTRRCRIERMTWADGDLGSVGMDSFVRDNFLLSEIAQGLTDSALHGVSFLINTQGQGTEPRSLGHVKDALNCTGTWNARTRRLDDTLSITSWDENDASHPTGFVLYLDGRTITGVKDDGKWEIEGSDHKWGVPVEPLVYKPRPSKRYGQSRLTRPIMGLHMQAVRELIRLEGHMDIYSYPEFWLLGGDMSSFRNADGTQKAVWQMMLGRFKGIEDNPEKPDNLARPEVKQFPASSPEPHAKALGTFAKLFAREASLPDSAVAIEGLTNPTSADSYDASQYEMIAEAEGAMTDWETPISRFAARGLAILNGYESVPDELLSIKPGWLGAKFESRAQKADAGSKQVAAVPWLAETEVGLELLGLDEQQIRRALAEKRRAAGRAVLASLASAPTSDADGQ